MEKVPFKFISEYIRSADLVCAKIMKGDLTTETQYMAIDHDYEAEIGDTELTAFVEDLAANEIYPNLNENGEIVFLFPEEDNFKVIVSLYFKDKFWKDKADLLKEKMSYE